ncbi:hypothetical protein OAO87_01195 [bacterium]|nr:hypothetical protein [bacterium]
MTVSFNTSTRHLEYEVQSPQLNPPTFRFVAFNLTGAINATPFATTFGNDVLFNNSFEILGAEPMRLASQATNDFNSMQPIFGLGIRFRSKFPFSLNTLDALYLRINAETSNYQSPAFNGAAHAGANRLVESSIFARIPITTAAFDQEHSMVEYTDPGSDLYQTFLNRKQLDTMDFRLTDAQGRSLAEIDPVQTGLGLFGFRMALRWDLFPAPERPPAEKTPPSAQDVQPDQPLRF